VPQKRRTAGILQGWFIAVNAVQFGRAAQERIARSVIKLLIPTARPIYIGSADMSTRSIAPLSNYVRGFGTQSATGTQRRFSVTDSLGDYDISLVFTGIDEGYDLINPEGEIFGSYRIASDLSPGREALLTKAQSELEEAYRRRSVLQEEANGYYKRAKE